jgi:fluoroquinolone transport system ATP-binding protein
MIDVRGLCFRYPRATGPVLHGLTFAVERGEIFGFLGPSGAGKSTTQKVLTGLARDYDGTVSVFGGAPRELGRSYYERIGVAFEVPNVYGNLTGRENLAFFASLYDGPTADPDVLLRLVGLDAAADMRAGAYSKGMRLRLNFGRALLAEPELLFLDEPTTGQDPDNARRIKSIIRARRAAGATIVLTTHDMTLAAELCDRVAFLVAGRIVLVDRPRALMVAHGTRRVRVEFRAGETLEHREFPLDGLGTDTEFLELLRTAHVESLHSLDATLEDVFVTVTGRALT